jgi:hypothetical protein
VKKIAAIFLLTIYVLSVTELTELLKVNVLIEHFHETTIKDGPVSFVDFLVMHYITDDGTRQDDDRDSQLPFKSHSSLAAGNAAGFILNRSIEITLAPAGVAKRQFYNYPDPFISSDFCNQVWNPPRLA